MRVRAILLLLLLGGTPAAADEPILVYSASNFWKTAGELGYAFEKMTGVRVAVSFGSTGTGYARIVNGAPYDVFFAADVERAAKAEASGYAVKGSRFTYALGQLVVWSSLHENCLAALLDGNSGRLAIANPESAPYGRASREYLKDIGAWNEVSPRVVRAQNVQHVFWMAAKGQVPLALIARAHAGSRELPEATCTFDVPVASHEPIEQQAVLINPDKEGAKEFMRFLQSEEAKEIIRDAGYGVPE